MFIYSKELDINNLSGKEIILYPAGRCASMVYRLLKKNNINISYFADKKVTGSIEGIEVITTEKLIKEHKDAIIIIGSVGHYIEIIKFLNNNNIKKIYDVSNLVNKDDVDKDDWQLMKQYKDTMEFYSGRKMILPNLDLVVTERCSLKCKNCSNLMQYYKSPKDYEIEDIVKPFRNILDSVDKIGEIRIIGGEPFMYKNLDKIIDICDKEEKIESILVLTNGTIIPKENVINSLKSKKVVMYISDYGNTSRNVKGLIEVLEANNIEYKHNIDMVWREFPELKNRSFNKAQLKDIYLKCCCKQLFVLQKDKFYICPFISNVNNLIEIEADNYVDCSSKENLGEKIKKFIVEKDYFTACALCGGRTGFEKEIPAAEQAERVLEFK